MKICILNISGNVGKSTLAVHLFAPKMPKAKIISVEKQNETVANSVKSLEVEEINASRFKDIYTEIMFLDDVIVDVGASNIYDFMSEVMRFKSSIGEFDKIIVPVVPADKQQKDTNKTIEWLNSNGFPANKIHVVFNQYDSSAQDDITDVYAHVIGYSLTDGESKAVYEPYVVIAQNEIFEMVKDKTISEIVNDATDYKAALAEAKKNKDVDAATEAIEGQMAKDLASTAQANLEEAYALIFNKKGK